MYEDYFPKVYNYIFYRLLSKEQTEDLVSDVFLKVVSHLNSYKADKASFGTWIFTIARNTLADFYRKHKDVTSIDDEAFPEAALTVDWDEQCRLIENEDRKALYKALSALNERQRNVLALKYFGDFGNREIAQITGINEHTVSSLGVRAVEKLKSLMGESYAV
jgi:RNA polymerase sigma-70 factor (ECF subfamily)